METFPIIKAHMSHTNTDSKSHIPKIQFQEEMINVSSVQSQNAFISSFFLVIFEIFARFILKMEQITYHTYNKHMPNNNWIACSRFQHILLNVCHDFCHTRIHARQSTTSFCID